MPSNKSNSNSLLPDRLYGEHYPDSFLDMPGPLRTTRYKPMDDNDRHVRQERNQPNQCTKSCEPCKSSEPNQPDCDGSHHANNTNNNCDRHKCKCFIPCSNTINNDTKQQLIDCAALTSKWESDTIQGPPIQLSSKDKDAISGWPCVVIGAIQQTWVSTTKRILGTELSERDTKRNIDAPTDIHGTASGSVL